MDKAAERKYVWLTPHMLFVECLTTLPVVTLFMEVCNVRRIRNCGEAVMHTARKFTWRV
jgi:hypothetical protein